MNHIPQNTNGYLRKKELIDPLVTFCCLECLKKCDVLKKKHVLEIFPSPFNDKSNLGALVVLFPAYLYSS